MSRPVKRSFTIAGHRTSISLAARGASGLSSAVRVWVLQHYREGARRGGRA